MLVSCVLYFIDQSGLLLFNPRHHGDQLHRTPLCGQQRREAVLLRVRLGSNGQRDTPETPGLGLNPGCCWLMTGKRPGLLFTFCTARDTSAQSMDRAPMAHQCEVIT